MASKNKQNTPQTREQRRVRTQQIIFAIIAFIIIFTWVVGLIVK